MWWRSRAGSRCWLAFAPTRDVQAWLSVQRGTARAIDEHRTLGVTCSFGEWLGHMDDNACAVHPGQDLPPMAISCGGPAARLSPQFLLCDVRP